MQHKSVRPERSRGTLLGDYVAFWAYILKCADGRYYTGHTDDLERRIAQHQSGGFCDFTSRRRPIQLVWSEYFATRLEALRAERQIKPWSRAKKEGLIRGDWAAVSFFAKPPRERPSTTLGTNGENADDSTPFVSSEVETPLKRPSTSLGTNGNVGIHMPSPDPSRKAGGE